MFQVYNPASCCYVKMEGGRILENSSTKFDGIPVKTQAEAVNQTPGESASNEPEVPQKAEQNKTSDADLGHSEAEKSNDSSGENKAVADEKSSQDAGTFFAWD